MRQWRLRLTDGTETYPVTDAFLAWIAENEPGSGELVRQLEIASTFAYGPLLSIVTPVYDPSPEDLCEAVESVLQQTYDRWELCLVDGGSRNPRIREVLDHYAARDNRIRVRYLERNLGISGNSNVALETTSGEFVVLLDHDDLLAPFALYEVVRLLTENREWDLIYSDHDVVTRGGSSRCRPLFKPDWSPDTMLSANYVTHLTAVRTKVLKEVGGFDPETDGAQDWDLFLRISERTQRIAHIPKILYHWRDAPGSTAVSVQAKPYVVEKQLRVLRRHLTRLGLRGATAFLDNSGFMRVAWRRPETPLVSIIIPSDGANHLLQTCVDSIWKETTYPRFEVVVVNNGIRRPEEFAYYKSLCGANMARVVHYDGPFNYSAVCNLGARHANGDLLLFLNNDTEALTADWLDELVLWGQREEVGVVGAKLLAPDGTIQHAGVVIGLTGYAGHIFAGMPEGEGGIFGYPEWYRDVLAVTGACMLVRRDVFERVERFSEEYVLCGSDVEFCLRVRSLGYRVVYNPFAKLRHVGSATHQGNIPPSDFAVSLQAYLPFLRSGDPYYNPNLSCWQLQPSLRMKNEASPLDSAGRLLELAKEGL